GGAKPGEGQSGELVVELAQAGRIVQEAGLPAGALAGPRPRGVAGVDGRVLAHGHAGEARRRSALDRAGGAPPAGARVEAQGARMRGRHTLGVERQAVEPNAEGAVTSTEGLGDHDVRAVGRGVEGLDRVEDEKRVAISGHAPAGYCT